MYFTVFYTKLAFINKSGHSTFYKPNMLIETTAYQA